MRNQQGLVAAFKAQGVFKEPGWAHNTRLVKKNQVSLLEKGALAPPSDVQVPPENAGRGTAQPRPPRLPPGSCFPQGHTPFLL